MAAAEPAGRANQRRRTRKDLLEAAARLMRQGGKPSLDEVAAEAMVSRATAYRYFSSVEALLREAALDVAAPDPDALFAGSATDDPVARLERADAAMDAMIRANEVPLRLMLAQALEQAAAGGPEFPARQNRRTPLIDAALAPARAAFAPRPLGLLRKALALVIGTEATVVFKDVLQLQDAEIRRVKRFAIRALVEAALRDSAGADRDRGAAADATPSGA